MKNRTKLMLLALLPLCGGINMTRAWPWSEKSAEEIASEKREMAAKKLDELKKKSEEVAAALKSAGAAGAGVLATYLEDVKKTATPENIQSVVDSVKSYLAEQWSKLAPDKKAQVTEVWDSLVAKLKDQKTSDGAKSETKDTILEKLQQFAEDYGLSSPDKDKVDKDDGDNR